MEKRKRRGKLLERNKLGVGVGFRGQEGSEMGEIQRATVRQPPRCVNCGAAAALPTATAHTPCWLSNYGAFSRKGS